MTGMNFSGVVALGILLVLALNPTGNAAEVSDLRQSRRLDKLSGSKPHGPSG